jgi:hypothetical protein
MHERQLRSIRRDGRALLTRISQRFAAKGSAQVAQEDEQQGPRGGKLSKRSPELRTGR